MIKAMDLLELASLEKASGEDSKSLENEAIMHDLTSATINIADLPKFLNGKGENSGAR